MSFESGKVYQNRYNDEYTWVILEENKFQFRITGDSMKYGRFGGKDGTMDWNDLGMFDPSGGPYVSVGDAIDGKKIVRIYMKENDIYAVTE